MNCIPRFEKRERLCASCRDRDYVPILKRKKKPRNANVLTHLALFLCRSERFQFMAVRPSVQFLNEIAESGIGEAAGIYACMVSYLPGNF
jgi:hypothetical protein